MSIKERIDRVSENGSARMVQVDRRVAVSAGVLLAAVWGNGWPGHRAAR